MAEGEKPARLLPVNALTHRHSEFTQATRNPHNLPQTVTDSLLKRVLTDAPGTTARRQPASRSAGESPKRLHAAAPHSRHSLRCENTQRRRSDPRHRAPAPEPLDLLVEIAARIPTAATDLDFARVVS